MRKSTIIAPIYVRFVKSAYYLTDKKLDGSGIKNIVIIIKPTLNRNVNKSVDNYFAKII